MGLYRVGDIVELEVPAGTMCNKHGVEYLVVGGYAFALHAHPRYTGDLDVFVKSSESNAHLIIEALSDFGFELSSLTWKDFATTGRVMACT